MFTLVFKAPLSHSHCSILEENHNDLMKPKCVYNYLSFNVTESKTVLDSEVNTVDSEFQVLDTGLFVSGTWIPDFNQDSLSYIADSKVRDSGFHKKKFPGF